MKSGQECYVHVRKKKPIIKAGMSRRKEPILRSCRDFSPEAYIALIDVSQIKRNDTLG